MTILTDEPERDFTREDLEPFDDDQDASSEEAKQEEALFSAADYDREDLKIPRVDGRQVTAIQVSFTGTVELDRSHPHDVAKLRALKLGQAVDLSVTGTVVGRPTTVKLDAEGWPTETITAAKVKVTSLVVDDGE